MSERFIGVDIAGQLTQPPHHVYCVATLKSKKSGQQKWVVCLTRQRIDQLSKDNPDWIEKVSAILIFRSADALLEERGNYAIYIDKDFHGITRKKVSLYLKRLFGVINYGKGFRADPPFDFLPKELNKVIQHADKKATLARGKTLQPDETDPPMTRMLDILEEARRKGIV